MATQPWIPAAVDSPVCADRTVAMHGGVEHLQIAVWDRLLFCQHKGLFSSFESLLL